MFINIITNNMLATNNGGKGALAKHRGNLGATMGEPWWNLAGGLREPWKNHGRKLGTSMAEPWRNREGPNLGETLPGGNHGETLRQPRGNHRGTLGEPWGNLGGTMGGTLGKP